MPPPGTVIKVDVSGPTTLSANSSQASVEFTDIVLGASYSLTIVAIDSLEVISAEVAIPEVTGKNTNFVTSYKHNRAYSDIFWLSLLFLEAFLLRFLVRTCTLFA